MNLEQLEILQDLQDGTLITDDRSIAILNELLVMPGHYHHQLVARTLQGIKSPSTVPYVSQALEGGFDYLAYTCSDDDVIAKWFSWILFSVGSPDAIELMEQYTTSPNEDIRKEMNYRLGKLKR